MRSSLPCLMLVVLATWGVSARADFYVVVGAANPQPALSQKDAVDLFMGRRRAFDNGEFALVFDLPRGDESRDAFYLRLTGMTPAQVNSYWSRLMFSGQSMPPQQLPNEAAMMSIIKRNPSAVGWLSKEPVDKGLRTVLVLKTPP
ncbi:MAG: hypothetical protein RL227_504 [Pseudomonadota bacterium]|jgi:hypothetical protein